MASTPEIEEVLLAWYADWRLATLAKIPGCLGMRKLVGAVDWNNHGVMYEFLSLDARNKGMADVVRHCLAHGFMRLTCDACARDTLAAFSCKRRGFCPSCGTRRMNKSAAYLVDEIIPHAPVRQWVLSFPIPLRSLFAVHPVEAA